MDARDWNGIAKNYFEEIVSPFQPGVINPLLTHLEKIPNAGQKTVVDLGCGIGNLFPYLCPQFRHVHAIDFSSNMLKECRKKFKYSNITYHQRKLTDLKPIHSIADLAITVNSVLPPSSARVDQIFKEIHMTLRKNGTYMGIFPSMESILYQGMLILDRESENGLEDKDAIRRTHRLLERHKYDFIAGRYTDDQHSQKLFYSVELRMRLKKAGFRNIRLGKVSYPWNSVGDFEAFPGRPKMWDWFVNAKF